MSETKDLPTLPDNLPVPEDDGACDHLTGMAVPAVSLPTFDVEYDGRPITLIKRLTLIIKDGVIEYVFYPVFPPDRSPDDVIAWLKNNA